MLAQQSPFWREAATHRQLLNHLRDIREKVRKQLPKQKPTEDVQKLFDIIAMMLTRVQEKLDQRKHVIYIQDQIETRRKYKETLKDLFMQVTQQM